MEVTIRRVECALLVFSLLAGCAHHAPFPTTAATAPSGGRALTARDVGEQPVLGWLGIPLGTITEIGAVVTTGDSKDDSDRYRLRVTQVDGRDLAEPVDLDFIGWHETKVTLPRERATAPAFLGRHVHLIVYETGEFSGNPTRGLEAYTSNEQGRAFHFVTSLVVLAEAPSAEGRPSHDGR